MTQATALENEAALRPPFNLRKLVVHLIIYAVLTIFAIGTLVPFAYMLCASLKSGTDFSNSLFLPHDGPWWRIAWDRLTLNSYNKLFVGNDLPFSFVRSIVNSFFLSSVISVLSTLCAAMGGYALAKFNFRGRNLITNLVLAALIIPGALLLAPSYQLLFHLHLLDSFNGLILPAMAPAFGVFLFRQSMIGSVPNELMEAARMDGCGEIRMFFTVALPLVRPMIGAFLLLTFLGNWNNFIGPQIVLQQADKFPLSVAIAQLHGLYGHDYGMLMAGTLLSVFPVLILFLLLQKEFIAGLTSGAVKG